jgi:hypothetical protein
MCRAAHILLVFCALLVAHARAATPPLTLEQYRMALENNITRLESPAFSPQDAAKLRDSLPLAWTVSDGRNEFSVPLLNIRLELDLAARPGSETKGGSKESKTPEETHDQHRQNALAQLRLLRAALDDKASATDTARAHDAANAILSQREFRFVKGESWWQRQQAKFWAFVGRILGKIFGAAFGWGGITWVVYGLAALILALFAWWIARLLLRGAPAQLSLDYEPAVSEKSATEWLADARAASAHGDWREAVRLAYWAGIASLESRGAWRPDRARTPREYLRLVGRQSSYFPSLVELTRHFERIWYGSTAATADDFSTALGQLEALGCR